MKCFLLVLLRGWGLDILVLRIGYGHSGNSPRVSMLALWEGGFCCMCHHRDVKFLFRYQR